MLSITLLNHSGQEQGSLDNLETKVASRVIYTDSFITNEQQPDVLGC